MAKHPVVIEVTSVSGKVTFDFSIYKDNLGLSYKQHKLQLSTSEFSQEVAKSTHNYMIHYKNCQYAMHMEYSGKY